MPLFRFFNKNKVVEKKSFSFSQISSGSFLEQALFGGRVTPHRAANFYRTSSAVAIAVDTIAKEIEQIEPVVELADGSLSDEHPVLTLLSRPNEFEDYRSFIGQLARNFLLNHDSFIYFEGAVNRPPINLFAINNQNVSVMENGSDGYSQSYLVSSGFGVGSYKRTTFGRTVKFLDGNLKQLYQIHGYSSRSSNSQADSPLEAAALEAQQQIKGKTHNLKIIENGGRLSLAVLIKGENPPTEEQFEAIERKANEKYAGSNNAGAIAVFGAQDLDIKEMGQTNKDMDFASMEKSSANAIYMRYGVPLPIISPDRQTYNNFDRAIEDLYDRAVIPYTKILFSGLTKVLRERFGQDSFVGITYNPEKISALRTRLLSELKIRKEINVETTNELRQGLPGREPLEGGDVYYQPANLIPVGEDLFTNDDPIVESPGNAINP